MTTEAIEARRALYETLPKDALIAEVGVWRGDNASLILDVAKPKRLILIDQWLKVEDDTNHDKMRRTEEAIDGTYRHVVVRFSAERNVAVLRMPSLEAATLFQDRIFDMVYVDANHHYEAVLPDLLTWIDKVKLGGILAGHDYTGRPGVRQAVDEVAERLGVHRLRIFNDACPENFALTV